jgi:hypothetical protein
VPLWTTSETDVRFWMRRNVHGCDGDSSSNGRCRRSRTSRDCVVVRKSVKQKRKEKDTQIGVVSVSGGVVVGVVGVGVDDVGELEDDDDVDELLEIELELELDALEGGAPEKGAWG